MIGMDIDVESNEKMRLGKLEQFKKNPPFPDVTHMYPSLFVCCLLSSFDSR